MKCGKTFILINFKCIPKKNKNIILENSDLFKEIIPFFNYNENSCFKIINNITILVENNITTYLDEDNYINDKKFEIKEFFIDCSNDKDKCFEYYKLNNNISKMDLSSNLISNCDNKNQEFIYEKIINKYLNITVIEYVDFCSKDKSNFYLKDEETFCNKNCINYKKIENFVNLTRINKCAKNYFNEQNHEILQYDKENFKNKEFDYCQKKLNYFCEWEKNCKEECKFDVIKGHSGINLKNLKKNILIKKIFKNNSNYNFLKKKK